MVIFNVINSNTVLEYRNKHLQGMQRRKKLS